MIMLITPGDKGEARIHFFADQAEMMRSMDWNDEPAVMPQRWLTIEQASEDTAYWREGDAFLASVAPLRLVPKQVAITHEIEAQ